MMKTAQQRGFLCGINGQGSTSFSPKTIPNLDDGMPFWELGVKRTGK